MKIVIVLITVLYLGSTDSSAQISPEILSIDELLGEILYEKQLSSIQNGNAFSSTETVRNRLDRLHTLTAQWSNQRWRLSRCTMFHNPAKKECYYLRLLRRFLQNNQNTEQTTDFNELLREKKVKLTLKYKNLSIEYANETYVGENNVEELMNRIVNSNETQSIWLEWNKQLKSIQNDFIAIIELYNYYRLDPTKSWNSDLKIDDERNELETATELWTKVESLYGMLEIFVHDSLNNNVHKRPAMSDNNAIQMHWLQTFTGVQFDQIFDQIKPYADERAPNRISNRAMFNRHISQIFGQKLAERIGQSSMLEIDVGSNQSCHPLTFDMFVNHEYSVFMRMCLNSIQNESNIRKIVHEFGHVLYFNSYRKQLNLVKLLSPNSAVHEAIGETFYLIHNNCHNTNHRSKASRINQLLREALNTFVRLPYALSLEKWRASLFVENKNITEINYDYWRIRQQFQNIVPAEYSGLQPLSKFHVINFMPYLRYYFSVFVTHQLYETFCGQDQFCCLNSTIVQRFDRFLTSDLTEFELNWFILTGKEWKYDAGPLIRYYAPLMEWLRENNKHKERSIRIQVF